MPKIIIWIVILNLHICLSHAADLSLPVSQPVLKYCPEISYPLDAIKKGAGGLVILKGIIGEDGVVKKSNIIFSNSDTSLVSTAVNTFSKCLYAPAIENPISREVSVLKSYRWTITDKEAVIQSRDFSIGHKCKRPDYPSSSRRAEEQGVVTMKFLISDNGEVSEAKVEISSGFVRLDEAAILGLVACKFKPPVRNENSTNEWSTIKYSWKLD